VQFDDDYYVSFHVAERVKVLCINGTQPNKYLNNVFSGAKYFHLDNADARALDYSRFEEYQLIVLNEIGSVSTGLTQELKTFAQNGGNILAFPPQNADLNAYNGFLQGFNAGNLGTYEAAPRQTSQINTEEFIFHDVYLNKSANLRLPATLGNFKIAANRGEYILTYRDGSAGMAKYQAGEGALYFSAAPLDEKINDLVRNGEIFVPMLFKMAIAGSKSRQIAYTIGKDEVLEANHQISALGETTYKLKKQPDNEQPGPESDQQVEFIPAQRILGAKVLLTPGTQVRDAGWYRLSLRPDSTLSDFAFNYDRKESELKYRIGDDLKNIAGKNIHVLDENAEANFGQVVGEQNQGIVLWRWCVIFALLFLALEVLFLRLWKV
jgi:hypothetical protein